MLRRVLICDDNVDAALSLKMLFELAGYQAVAVYSPQSALNALSPPPDAIILDIGLPGMDGYELARQIRTRLGAAPFLVAVTGWGSPADVRRAMEAGFDRHFCKPADPNSLLVAINKETEAN